MYNVFIRPCSRCSKKDINFKLYIERVISYILDDIESLQDWLNSSFPLWPGYEELRQIEHLLQYQLEGKVKNQLESLEEKKLDYEDYEDECYRKWIQD